MKEAVVIQTKLNNTNMNGMLDSGAACCVKDLGTVEKIGKRNEITPINNELFDASNNKMRIIGAVDIPIRVSSKLPTIIQRFYVLNSRTNCNILLGRDFMAKFGRVQFDFKSGKVQLGNQWLNCVNLNGRKRVKLYESAVVKARSEQVVTLKCDPKLALLSVDFEAGQLKTVMACLYQELE